MAKARATTATTIAPEKSIGFFIRVPSFFLGRRSSVCLVCHTSVFSWRDIGSRNVPQMRGFSHAGIHHPGGQTGVHFHPSARDRFYCKTSRLRNRTVETPARMSAQSNTTIKAWGELTGTHPLATGLQAIT